MIFIEERFEGNNYDIEQPDFCPFCHRHCIPKYLWSGPSDLDKLITLWKCPNSQCEETILAEHKLVKGTSDILLKRYINGNPIHKTWPESIINLESGFNEGQPSKFIEIYNQALRAESDGLDEIVGMGFRKALEHLVKDVVAIDIKSSQKEPDEISSELEKLKGLLLWPVIDKYFSDDLKTMLQKASWLGNDQVHYIKIYEEFDIPELKEIIDLIVYDLDQQLRKKRFLDLESRKK